MKNIQDFLHLYLGCQVQTKNGIGKLVGILPGGRYKVRFDYKGRPLTLIKDEFRLVLRPLDSMSDQERNILHAVLESMPIKSFDDTLLKNARVSKFLTEQSFDLHDLIEANLATSATTVNNC